MYEKFLIIAGRKIWKAVAEHKLNCRFVCLGEGAILTDTDIEVLHFKRKKKLQSLFTRVCCPRWPRTRLVLGNSLRTTNLRSLCSFFKIIP